MNMKTSTIRRILPSLALAALMLFAATASHAAATDAASVEVSGFMRLLEKDAPSLADYQKYYGYRDTEEVAFQWKECEGKGWAPTLQNSSCYQGIIQRWSAKEASPSLFLAWLKTRLPAHAKVATQNVARVGLAKGEVPGERIAVGIGATSAVFWRPANEADAAAYGRLSLVELDGMPLAKLIQQAAAPSVLGAMGLNTLLRPLTPAEQKAMQEKAQARCAADSECAKRMAENEKEMAEHKKDDAVRAEFSRKFVAWCDANGPLCEKLRSERDKLTAARKDLQAKCEKDYDQCLPQAAQWLKALDEQRKPFCAKYGEDCAAIDALHQKQDAEQRALCKDHPDTCAKVPALERALLQARQEIAGDLSRGKK